MSVRASVWLWLPGVLLQRGVGRRAQAAQRQRRVLAARPHQLDQAEVDQFDHTGGGQDDVARLDVAVNDGGGTLAVQIGQGIQHLVGPAEDGLLRQGSAKLLRVAIEYLLQILALDEVHHQVLVVAHGEIV
jgi:hypothetical protein